MMSCKQVTHLISEQLDRELSRGERMAMNFHLMMCTGCSNFRNNMRFLRKACHGLADDTPPKDE